MQLWRALFALCTTCVALLPGRTHSLAPSSYLSYPPYPSYPSSSARLHRSTRYSTTKLLLTLNVLIVGKKTTEDWIMQGILEYETRLRPVMTVHTTFLKSDEALVLAVKNIKGVVYAMDETGKQVTSRDFSEIVFKGFEEGGANLCFVIGGFDGLPEQIKANHRLISLSKMTWTHQMARLLLIEQVYRASEIHKGSGYHKD